MSELEDKLNSLLSNQDAMAQVMQLAQSLSQSGVGAADSRSAASPPPPQSGAADSSAPKQAGPLRPRTCSTPSTTPQTPAVDASSSPGDTGR